MASSEIMIRGNEVWVPWNKESKTYVVFSPPTYVEFDTAKAIVHQALLNTEDECEGPILRGCFLNIMERFGFKYLRDDQDTGGD